jgi:putative FmdB family regulatory protein
MPIHEYECRACGHRFEALVRSGVAPSCPSCQAVDPERLLSLFAVSSGARSRSALQEARRQLTNSSARRDEVRHQQEEIRTHVQEDYGLRLPEDTGVKDAK